jgi:serine/threonine-protein kinase
MASITEALKVALADRYVIEQEVGAGGMATVYLAHDVKHDRKVALKVLRPELAAVIGAERFLNEIKVTANLQHPHILPLHDSGEADTFLYYVMPFVEGDTLRDKLDREKQLGIENAIEITRGIAAALDYAHRQGVIHRDIKPENILIHDGQPLVADFGIALAVSAAGGNRLTETGLSIGTPHYMSPEQAMGDRELDARSDVYSLGAMLYEMLAGDPPYTGSTAQAIVAKVITEKAPPVTATRDTVPPNVAAAIQKSLAKLPADRFGSAADFADALARPSASSVAAATTGAAFAEDPAAARTLAVRLPSMKQTLPWLLIAAASAVALLGWLQRPAPHISRFALAVPQETALTINQGGNTLALSPDGRQLVYVGPERRLFVRNLDDLEAHPLPGTENARAPFFSPDGEWVGFYADGRLSRVALGGGPPLTITETQTNFRGASWGDGDIVILTRSTSSPLFRVPAAGGDITQLTQLDTSTTVTSHRWPHVLPGGKAVVFAIYNGTMDETELAAASIETGEVIRLQLRGLRAQYAATGHLVYGTADGSLVAVPFDKDRLEVNGAPVSLIEGLMVRSSVMAEFEISRTGALAYLDGLPPDLSLVAVDRNGLEDVLVEGLQQARAPRISVDGTRIALELDDGSNTDVWVYDLRAETMTRMTFWGGSYYPAWTPDDASISFTSIAENSNNRNLFILPSDGSGVPEPLYEAAGEQWESLWLPDGRSFIVRSTQQGTTRDIGITTLDGGDLRPLVNTEFEERSPSLSPDGRWLAYCSNESSRNEVYVRPVSEVGGKRQVSVDGGGEPLWSRDGREVYYRGLDDNIYAVAIETSPTLRIGQRSVLFEDKYVRNFSHSNYDQHPGDGRFVFIKGSAAPTDLVLVLNWFEELKQRMER